MHVHRRSFTFPGWAFSDATQVSVIVRLSAGERAGLNARKQVNRAMAINAALVIQNVQQ